MSLFDAIRNRPSAPCRPWPRTLLDPPAWRAMAAALATDPSLDLLAQWGDVAAVHALLRDPATGTLLPVSVPTESGFYPTLSRARPAAAWFERMIRDLWGHHAEDGRDGRPWLDHGAWALHAPLSARPVAVPDQPEAPEFLPAIEGTLKLPLGPILPGFAEPAQLRVAVAGDRIARLEGRLGFAHKGTLSLLRGKSPRAAARFAARLAGDATVAHSLAFARAAEAASGTPPPPRALALRAAMAEIERIASHLADLGRIAAPAALARLQEGIARAAGSAFGHRLMMDAVVPGGVESDLAADGAAAIGAAVAQVREALPALRRRFDDAGHLAGLGVLRPEVARALAVDDAAGDVAARVARRLEALGGSTARLGEMLAALPDGRLRADLPPSTGEGIGAADGARGEVFHMLRLEGGQIVAAFAADPGWRLWPALEAAAAGTTLADLDVVVASFGVSVAGMDL
jgi:Ni,Fe-hydrogenase III large subunit